VISRLAHTLSKDALKYMLCIAADKQYKVDAREQRNSGAREERVYDASGITLDVIAEAHNAGSSSFASPSFPSGTPTLNALPRFAHVTSSKRRFPQIKGPDPKFR